MSQIRELMSDVGLMEKLMVLARIAGQDPDRLAEATNELTAEEARDMLRLMILSRTEALHE